MLFLCCPHSFATQNIHKNDIKQQKKNKEGSDIQTIVYYQMTLFF